MVNTRGTHKRRRLPAALYLCYLLVAVLAFTGASVAGYKTESTGEDSARVARFAYASQAGSDSESIALDATDSAKSTGEYTFTVSNKDTSGVSEVAQKCSVLVTCAGKTSAWLPSGVSMTLTCEGKTINAAWNGSGYMFSDVCLFEAAVEKSADCVLTFSASENADEASLSGISVTVCYEQID